MSFTGIALEMAAIDDGMSKAVDMARKALGSVNDMLEKQANKIRKIKKEDIYASIEKGASKVGKAIKGIGFDSISDGIQASAIKADDFLSKIEKSMSDFKKANKQHLDDLLKPMRDIGDGFRKIGGSISESFDLVIGQRLKKLKPVFDGIKTSVTDTANSVHDRFSKIYGSMKNIGGKISGVMSSLQNRVMQFNVASIASSLQSLTGETGNLSNAMESTMAGMMQTTKPIVAGLNLTSNEMKKLSSRAASMAYGLNTDAGAVAETMKSMMTANQGAKQALDALGMSEKDWVKVVQTTNMKMEDYTGILGDLTTSWDMAPKKAAGLVDSLVAIGKKAGVGTLALQGTKENLSAIDAIFGKLPPGMQRTSDEIYTLVESAARGAGVFKEFGVSETEAVSNANAVAKMFAEQSVAMQRAFEIGGEGAALEDSPLFKYFNRLGLGYAGARDIIDTGSRDVVAGMKKINDLYSSLGSSQLLQAQQALGGLNESLGAGVQGLEFLAMSTTKGTEAISKFENMSIKGDGALKQFGKDAYSSGLTLQDTYDRAKLSFDTTIRSIARSQVVGLVKKQMQGMKEAGQEIKTLAGDETWGPWVNAMSQFKQMGMSGVFASLAESTGTGAKNAAKFGSKVGLIFDTIGDVGKEMAPVMQMFGMLGPLGPLLAAGGIAGLLIMDDSSAREVLGPMYDIFNSLKQKAITVWDTFSPRILKAWNESIAPRIKTFWSEDLVPFLKEIAPKIGGALWEAIKWAWNQIGESFGTGGQAATVLGAGLVTGMSVPLIGLAGQAGMKMLSVLSSGSIAGSIGLIGLAAAAGVAIGDKIREAFVDPKIDEIGKGMKAKDAAESFKNTDLSKYSEKALKSTSSTIGQGLKLEQSALASLNADTMARGGMPVASTPGIDLMIYTKKRIDEYLKSKKINSDIDTYVAERGMDEWSIMTDSNDAGYQTISTFGDGFQRGAEETIQKIDTTQADIAKHIGQSLPTEGPLKDGIGAYNGGYDTMMSFAQGIYDSTEIVRNTVTQLMDDAVITSIDVYATKMKELTEQKSLLESVAKSMVRDLGGKLDMTPDPEANVNIKKNFEAALSVPGLAGVILAISNEGAQTRKMQKKMLDELSRQTSIMSGKQPSAKGGSVYVPAP